MKNHRTLLLIVVAALAVFVVVMAMTSAAHQRTSLYDRGGPAAIHAAGG